MYLHDVTDAHYTPSNDDDDLIKEMRANVSGPHSEPLRKLLHRMRWGHVGGVHRILVVPQSGYQAAVLVGARGSHSLRREGPVFESLSDAELYIFEKRWRLLFGQSGKQEEHL